MEREAILDAVEDQFQDKGATLTQLQIRAMLLMDHHLCLWLLRHSSLQE
jgi:hypothetical protein